MMRHACLPLSLLLAAAVALAGEAPTPPEQPKTGPGGSDYAHKDVVRHVYEKGVEQYWIFEPDEPKPRTAPLVVFNHGWLGMAPQVYLGWIQHIVRRGNIVVFPRYQTGALTPPWTFVPNAVKSVKLALEELKKPDHVAPDLARFAIVGHSAGGAITADMAALAAEEGLPEPKALMIVLPGRGVQRAPTPFFPPAGYEKIPKDVLLLVVVGDEDRLVGSAAGKEIFKGTPQIPLDRKDFITVRSDRHGVPPFVADHVSPCAPVRPLPILTGHRVDAVDYYAYWRLFDALTDYAFHGRNKEHALGNTPEQRFMGRWSDGEPVNELLVTDEP